MNDTYLAAATRTVAAVIATAALVLLAAACGGSPSSAGSGSSNAGGSAHTQSPTSRVLAFFRCVRAHGVPEFPTLAATEGSLRKPSSN